jgi:hypothetical protein
MRSGAASARAPASPRMWTAVRYSLLQMSFDQSKIGQVVAAQMEALEGRYGEDCEIGNVCTIVEVLGPHGSDVSVRSSEARPHTTIGLLRMAEAMMLNRLGGVTRGEEE